MAAVDTNQRLQVHAEFASSVNDLITQVNTFLANLPVAGQEDIFVQIQRVNAISWIGYITYWTIP